MPPHEPTDPNESAPKPIDPASILLPKKEGPSTDSAQRVEAGALLAQEKQAAAPTIGDLSKPAAPPPPPPKEESVVKALETFGGDINRLMQSGGVSVTSIAAAESKRAHMASGQSLAPGEVGIGQEPPASPMRPVLYIAGGLLLLSAVGIATVVVMFMRPRTVVVQGSPEAPFVAVDQTIAVPPRSTESRDLLMTDLTAARQSVNLPLGLVARLYPTIGTTTPEPLPVAQLLSTLSPDVPQDLLRTLLPQYLLGVHSYDENQAFLILRVDSYQQAYAGMLVWEPIIKRDLSPLFTRTPSPHANDQTADLNASSATSTDPGATEFLNTGFTDQVVDNHDARVVTNSAGDILLLWTFLDRNTLVIATNSATLNEIITRLNTASLVPQP